MNIMALTPGTEVVKDDFPIEQIRTAGGRSNIRDMSYEAQAAQRRVSRTDLQQAHSSASIKTDSLHPDRLLTPNSAANPIDPSSHKVLGTAWEVANELDRSIDVLDESEIDCLLNAAFATQKRYFRTLGGGYDAVQQRLFVRLSQMAKGRTLPAFQRGITDSELETMASSLSLLLEMACITIDERERARRTSILSLRKSGKAMKDRRCPAFPEEILKARAATEGKRLLIVGGICKEADRERIAQAFACEVTWLNAKKGMDMQSLKAAASRSHLMVSLIKLSGHFHSDGMGAFSRQTGIPLVRIPAGFSPIAIAQAVNRQILRSA